MATYKAQALANFVAEELAVRLGAANVSGVKFAKDSNPWIQVGAGTAGAVGGVVKVMAIDWPLAKDVLGLPQTVFTPHVIQVVTEANPAGGAGADVNTVAVILAMIGTTLLKGCRLEWYVTANGTAPAVDGTTGLVNGTLSASFESLYYPMVSGQ